MENNNAIIGKHFRALVPVKTKDSVFNQNELDVCVLDKIRYHAEDKYLVAIISDDVDLIDKVFIVSPENLIELI